MTTGTNRIVLGALTLFLGGLTAPRMAGYPLQLAMSGVGNSVAAFNGTNDTVTIQNSTLAGSSGFDFLVNAQSGFPGSNTSLIGAMGNIGGTYTIGAITTSPDGTTQTAAVAGTGTLSIFDGVNTLTSVLNWVNIETLKVGSGASGGFLNTEGVVNLSNFSYSGSNQGLQEIAANSGGTLTATFQFSPAKTLSQLTTDLADVTSYSASFSVVPEPSFYWLLALGMSGLLALTRRKNS